jgi:hypothetical protein
MPEDVHTIVERHMRASSERHSPQLIGDSTCVDVRESIDAERDAMVGLPSAWPLPMLAQLTTSVKVVVADVCAESLPVPVTVNM